MDMMIKKILHTSMNIHSAFASNKISCSSLTSIAKSKDRNTIPYVITTKIAKLWLFAKKISIV